MLYTTSLLSEGRPERSQATQNNCPHSSVEPKRSASDVNAKVTPISLAFTIHKRVGFRKLFYSFIGCWSPTLVQKGRRRSLHPYKLFLQSNATYIKIECRSAVSHTLTELSGQPAPLLHVTR
eukprot:gene13378-9205_t